MSGVNRILRAQTWRRFDKQILGKEVISPWIIFDENFVPDPSHEYQEDEDFIDFVTHGNNYRNASIKVHRLTTSIINGFKVQKGKAVRFKNHFEPERINTRKI